MMRIVFMGTPDFAVPCLESLLDAGHEVVGVYCRPDREAGRGRRIMAPPVKRFCHRMWAACLPTRVPPARRDPGRASGAFPRRRRGGRVRRPVAQRDTRDNAVGVPERASLAAAAAPGAIACRVCHP